MKFAVLALLGVVSAKEVQTLKDKINALRITVAPGGQDRIEAAGDMQPSLVAGGIKIALLTTVFGLIVAIILQVFYNYIVAKIDSIVNDMEDASITLIDILSAQKK